MMSESNEQRFEAGRAMMDRVYGKGFLHESVKAGESPYIDETVAHLFADIWSRPGLSIRDRRLLVIGATAALGRADLIEFQVKGALANGELSKAELDEIPLQLAFYVGWGNSTAVMQGIQVALTSRASASK
jgi:alkylhydroperoxidase/carboxymuconolactone decarboxylase family protein YurZ